MGLLRWEQAKGESLTCLFKLTIIVHLHDLAIGGVSVHAKAHGLDLLDSAPLDKPVVRFSQNVDQLERLSGDVQNTANTGEEHSHILTVDDFFDGDRLSVVLDLLADEILLEVVQTLLRNKGRNGGSCKDDLVVVWAVWEDFLAGGGRLVRGCDASGF